MSEKTTNQQKKRMSPEEFAQYFVDRLYRTLKAIHKTMDISPQEVENYLKENKLTIPKNLRGFEGLMETMFRQYGSVLRSDGTGEIPQRFLVLRKAQTISQNLREQVYRIVVENFDGQSEIDNALLGNTFISNGIRYKELGYTDLTSFLREFPELFIIKVEENGDVVRIHCHLNSASIRRLTEKYGAMKKRELRKLLEEGNYRLVLTENVCTEAIKKKDIELLLIVIQAMAHLEHMENQVEVKDTLTDWEKGVLTYVPDLSDKLEDGKYMLENGFSGEQVEKIKNNLALHPEEKLTFNAIGQRIRNLCGEENKLAYYFYQMGLMAGTMDDRVACCRFLVGYCAEYQKDMVEKIWKLYKDLYVTKVSMERLVVYLFEKKCFDVLLYITSSWPQRVEDYTNISVYEEYTKILVDEMYEATLPSIAGFLEDDQRRIAEALLDELICGKRMETFCCVFHSFLSNSPQAALKIILDNYLVQHQTEILDVWEGILSCAGKREKETWIVVRFILASGLFPEKEALWMEYSEQYFPNVSRYETVQYEAFKEMINETPTEKHREMWENLLKGDNAHVLMAAYEKREIPIPSNIEIYHFLSRCFYENDRMELAIEAKHEEVLAAKNKEERLIFKNELLELIAEAGLRGNRVHLHRQLAEDILSNYVNYVCESAYIKSYLVAIMFLALSLKRGILAALLYSLWEENGKEDYPAFCENVENAVLEAWGNNNQWRLGNLINTYEYILCTEDMDSILLYAGFAAKVLQSHKVKMDYQYATFDKEVIDEPAFFKFCIINYKEEYGWRYLAKYTQRTKNLRLNYIANLMALYKFNDQQFSLKNCTDSLLSYSKNSFSTNFIQNNLLLMKQGRSIPDYWDAFVSFVNRYQHFKTVSQELIREYLVTLQEQTKGSSYNWSIALCILEQTGMFKEFFDQFYNEDVEKALQSDSKSVIKILALIICETAWSDKEEYLQKGRILRAQIKTELFGRQDRAALLWIDKLYSMKEDGTWDERFAHVSKGILLKYPEAPGDAFVSENILVAGDEQPHYLLIRYWLGLYGNIQNLFTTCNYFLNSKLPKWPSERREVYELLLWVLKRLLSMEGEQRKGYLRISKNFLTVCYLTNTVEESALFLEKVGDTLKKQGAYAYFKDYGDNLDKLWHREMDFELKEKILWCGITLKWWDFLEDILFNQEVWGCLDETFMDYVKCLDYRDFRRNLLKKYFYINIAGCKVNGLDTDGLIVGTRDEIEVMCREMETGSSSLENYLSAIESMTALLCPVLGEVMEFISGAGDSVEKKKRLYALGIVRKRVSPQNMADNIGRLAEGYYNEIIIPCLTALQYSNYIAAIVEEWAYAGAECFLAFLSNPLLAETLGDMSVCYYSAVYWAQKGDYEKAGESFRRIEGWPVHMKAATQTLAAAIEQKQKPQRVNASASVTKAAGMLRFSFMHSAEAGDVSFDTLLANFYGENGTEGAQVRCKWAQMIYYHMLEGRSVGDVYDFIFRWGFYAMDCESGVERKMHILFELMDNMYVLKNTAAFRKHFVEQFIFILNECDFLSFAENIVQIKKQFDKLYGEFRNVNGVENLGCYAELLKQLSKLADVVKGSGDVEKLQPEIEQIRQSVLVLRKDHPNNYFAHRSEEFVNLFIRQHYARSLYEVRILNQDKKIDGSVFYQIKNVSLVTIAEVTMTMYFGGYEKETIITEKIPGGLRPNQVFAGEYIPKEVAAEEGEELEFVLLLNDSNAGDKDGLSFRELLTVHREEYVFPEFDDIDINIGYPETTIKQNEQHKFVERKEELKEIIGAMKKGSNVVIYGTNGTGKSSILNNLTAMGIPRYCRREEIKPVIIHLTIDAECTVERFVNDLLNELCDSKHGELAEKLRVLQANDPTLDISNVITAIGKAEVLRKDIPVFDEDGINSNNLIRIFKCISPALDEVGVKVFLLWDNFELISASPNVDATQMGFLKTLTENSEATGNVIFIFSGSNGLLEIINNKHGNNLWNTIFARSTKDVKVGNMARNDFENLMNQKRALNDGEIYYSREALEYLWQYTNGHAFYSCLIGNGTLRSLSTRKVSRKCIYPSDIARVIDKMNADTTNSSTNKLRTQIFQDISEDIPVKYVGKTLAHYVSNGSEDRIERRKLWELVKESRRDISEEEYERALDILVARDFVQELTSDDLEISSREKLAWVEYSFTSDLYLEYFRDASVPEEVKEKKNSSLVTKYLESPKEEQMELRELLSSNVYINQGTVFDHGSVQNVQINVQNISNVLNTVLLGNGDLQDAYQKLPKLQDYQKLCLEDAALKELRETQELLKEEQDEVKRQEYAERVVELNEPVCEKMGSDFVVAVAGAVAEDEELLFEAVNDERLLALLKIDKDQLSDVKSLLQGFQMQFSFATILHNIFTKFEETENVDYCPVTLLYCKLIESILKKKHTPIYRDKLPDATISTKSNSAKFGDFVNVNKWNQNKKNLTMGSYTAPIVWVNYTNPGASQVKEEGIEALGETAREQREWRNHAKAMAKILVCRNKSAHDDRRVSKSELDMLIELLFEREELIRVIELAK